jgi:hypothetical protein
MAAEADWTSLFQNPLFIAGLSGMTAPRGQESQYLLKGLLTGQQVAASQQAQKLNALKLQQMQAQQNFNPQDYMQTTPAQGTSLASAMSGEQPAAMPATLGGPTQGGMAQMLPQQDMQQPLTPQPGIQTGRVDMQGMLGGGLAAGMSPAEVQQIGMIMDPQGAAQQAAAAKLAEPYTLAPGQSRMVGSQVLGTNGSAPPGDPAAMLNRTIAAAQQARAAGNIPLAEQLESLVQKQSGAFDQQARLDQLDIARQNHADNLDLRRQSMENQQGQRAQQNDFAVQRQAVALGTQLEKSGIPQADQVLNTIESIVSKYPPGQLPGYGKIQGLLPSAALNEDGQKLRQAVAALANINLKQRSGAAVTDQEYARFKQELGNSAFVPEERIRQGIGQMRSMVEAQKKNYAAAAPEDAIKAYEENGGIPLSQYRHKRASVSLDEATPDDIAAAIRRKLGK